MPPMVYALMQPMSISRLNFAEGFLCTKLTKLCKNSLHLELYYQDSSQTLQVPVDKVYMIKIDSTTLAVSYLELECNFCFFVNPLFWVSGDKKRPANSCKWVAFAAGVQEKPKCCRALKAAKGPWILFKLSLNLRSFSSGISVKSIRHIETCHSSIVTVTYCNERWLGFKV